jgi:hypothetical protein
VVSLKEKSNGQEESKEEDSKKDHQEKDNEEGPQEDREKEEEIMSPEQSLLARLCRLRASDAANHAA